LADIIDLVPADVQGALEGEVEATAGLEQGVSSHSKLLWSNAILTLTLFIQSGGLAAMGDKVEAFIIAEAVAPLTDAAMRATPPPLPPRPVRFGNPA
jgi:hypothetical protein